MANVALRWMAQEDYFGQLIRTVKAEQPRRTVIYVTTNYPYEVLTEVFRRAGIDTESIFFIDCVTKKTRASQVKEPDNGVFVAGPQNLTDLSIAIHQSIKTIQGKKTIVFDSHSTLSSHHDGSTLARFFDILASRVKAADAALRILALESDREMKLVKAIQPFLDEVNPS